MDYLAKVKIQLEEKRLFYQQALPDCAQEEGLSQLSPDLAGAGTRLLPFCSKLLTLV